MKLFQLAYACRIYAGLSFSDASYDTFMEATRSELNFLDSSHLKALLVWLNAWGCRQFAIEYHELAADSLGRWAQQGESQLPGRSTTTDRLGDQAIEAAADAYADISKCVASRKRKSDGQLQSVHVGPTGAAKILFAARPTALPPWDDAIRVHFQWDGGRDSYCAYLKQVREQISELHKDAARFGVRPESLPVEVGRPRSTVPKLIDEYNWVTVTRKILPVEPRDIAKWHMWSGSQD